MCTRNQEKPHYTSLTIFLCSERGEEHEILVQGEFQQAIPSNVLHQGRKHMDRLPQPDQRTIQAALVPCLVW